MRLAISGVGMVSALGADAESTWRRVRDGDCGLVRVPAALACGFDAPPLVGDASRYLRDDGTTDGARTARFAVQAAREALASASLDPRSSRVGLLVGGTTSGMFEAEGALARLAGGEPVTAIDRASLAHHPLSATTAAVARALGPFVRSQTVSAACASGAVAIGLAAMWINLGIVDVVLAGASEGLCRLTLAGFASLGLLATDACRPFDELHGGLTLGEGAGFVVLERAAHLRARGVVPIAELRGVAFGTEAYHPTAPDPDGTTAVSLIRASLAQASVSPESVDAVFAHGTGTLPNDSSEARALAKVFGAHAPPVAAQKGQLGHALGASATLETVLAVLALRDGVLPGTVGFRVSDRAAPIAVTRTTQSAQVTVVLKTSFGFGGMDAMLVLAKPPTDPSASSTKLPDARLPPRTIGIAAAVTLDLLRDHSSSGSQRRFDRASVLALAAGRSAISTSESEEPVDAVVYGGAFGRVEASATFLQRLAEKGPRFVRPIEFPNLLPSAQAANVSLALGVRGPTFAVCAEPLAAEEAFIAAYELVLSGLARRSLACAAEEKSPLVERVQVASADAPSDVGVRGREEGAFAAVLTTAVGERSVAHATLFEEVMCAAEPLGCKPRVISNHGEPSVRARLAGTAWERVPIESLRAAGASAGGGAIVAAVRSLNRGEATSVLVLGLRSKGGTAIVIV